MKPKTARLGVNIDHVATLRQLRNTPYPNLLAAAQECVAGGADQITVHLREDRRHIQDADLFLLKANLAVDLNFEMAATAEMIEIAAQLKPFSVCIVPEKREERTTEGGLDLTNPNVVTQLKKISQYFTHSGSDQTLISFFIEPKLNDIKLAQTLGAQAVELHTGAVCLAFQQNNSKLFESLFNELRAAAEYAAELGLKVHAGHGIDYQTLPLLSKINQISEFNIGHVIVCEAVFIGLKQATQKLKQLL